MRKQKICEREIFLAANTGTRRATKRKTLLQYLRDGRVSPLFGDFKTDVVAG